MNDVLKFNGVCKCGNTELKKDEEVLADNVKLITYRCGRCNSSYKKKVYPDGKESGWIFVGN